MAKWLRLGQQAFVKTNTTSIVRVPLSTDRLWTTLVADHHKMLAKFTVAWKICFYWPSLVHYGGCCSVAKSCPTLWPQLHQAPLSSTISWNLLKLMSVESVMLSNHLSRRCSLLLPPLIFPSIRGFSKESALCIRWPKYWSFSFSIRPSKEYSGFILIQTNQNLSQNDILDILLWCHRLGASEDKGEPKVRSD